MWALATFFMIIVISYLVQKVAATALVLTGLSKDVAQFQARSAFSTTGFATAEAEQLMEHPVRRRILSSLMIMGNAGLATMVVSLLLGVADTTGLSPWEQAQRFIMVIAVTALFFMIVRASWFDYTVTRVITWMLVRVTNLEVRDYEALFHLGDDYQVAELPVTATDWICQKSLMEAQLNKEGVLVLGIQRRDGTYLGAPQGSSEILPGDVLVIYGQRGFLDRLHKRKAGTKGDIDRMHAVIQHTKMLEKEIDEDRRTTRNLQRMTPTDLPASVPGTDPDHDAPPMPVDDDRGRAQRPPTGTFSPPGAFYVGVPRDADRKTGDGSDTVVFLPDAEPNTEPDDPDALETVRRASPTRSKPPRP